MTAPDTPSENFQSDNTQEKPAKIILPIKETQAQMITSLLRKKGWNEEDFWRESGKLIAELTSFEARKWIARLTEETRGPPGKPQNRYK